MGVWVQKNYGGGKTSAYFREGTVAGPVLDDTKTKLAVSAIQNELRYIGYKDTRNDGIFDKTTTAMVKKIQTDHQLVVDGIVGPKTARLIFSFRVKRIEDIYHIPAGYLYGLIDLESNFDPAAVGVNGYDSGLAQINLDPVNGHGGEITQAQAFSPQFALDYTGARISAAFVGYRANLDELAWKLAIGQHNSPLNALRWEQAALAVPPGPTADDSLTRIDSVSKYVAAVVNRINQ